MKEKIKIFIITVICGLSVVVSVKAATVIGNNITTAGNMGIGTSSPSSKLDVFADSGERAPVHVSSGGSTRIIVDSTNADADVGYSYSSNGVEKWQMYINGDDNLLFSDGVNARMFFDRNTGNIGINTATATMPLSVGGNTYINGALTVTGAINSTGSTSFSSLKNGDVSVVHPDGSVSYYTASSSTDVARGNALLQASQASHSGDTIRVSANTFDIGTGTIDLSGGQIQGSINLVGSGKYSTIIKGGANGGSIVKPGSRTLTSDLSLIATDPTVYTFPWGLRGEDNGVYPETIHDAVLRDVYISGHTDGLYFMNNDLYNGETLATVINVDVDSDWDSLYDNSLGVVNIYNSHFNSVANPSSVDRGQYAHALVNNDGGVINVYNSVIKASGGSTENIGVSQEGQSIFLSGTTIETSGTNAHDIKGSQHTKITPDVIYSTVANPASVQIVGSGASVLWSLSTFDFQGVTTTAAFTNNFVGIGTSAPDAKLKIVGQNANNYITLLGSDSTASYNTITSILTDNGGDFGSVMLFVNPEEGVNFNSQSADLTRNSSLNIASSGEGMSFSQNGSTAFAVNPSGNVGIGSQSSNALLHVYRANATTTVELGGADSAQKGTCLKLRDSNGGGWTYCTALHGALNCSTVSCE